MLTRNHIQSVSSMNCLKLVTLENCLPRFYDRYRDLVCIFKGTKFSDKIIPFIVNFKLIAMTKIEKMLRCERVEKLGPVFLRVKIFKESYLLI